MTPWLRVLLYMLATADRSSLATDGLLTDRPDLEGEIPYG